MILCLTTLLSGCTEAEAVELLFGHTVVHTQQPQQDLLHVRPQGSEKTLPALQTLPQHMTHVDVLSWSIPASVWMKRKRGHGETGERKATWFSSRHFSYL